VAKTTIDDYIASFPDDVQKILDEVRETIRRAAPGAVESISYQIPTYKLDDRPLIYFAGWKQHISVYPIPPGGDDSFQHAFSGYRTGRGTVQFPLDQQIPYELIAKMVELHVARITGIQG
jgi:uncharacterized protein YdhG (YjbR/CyaY superfamily)